VTMCVTREQEPLILPKHKCSPPVFSGFVFLDLSFLKCFVQHWLRFFPLAIALPDLLRFTASDYIFDNIANNSMSTILISVCTRLNAIKQCTKPLYIWCV
jgi:hypothetical protein